MKIEKISDGNFKIYIYIKQNCDDLEKEIKKIIKKLQKKLKINGFYKVICIEKKYGLFLELIKVEDAYYKSTLDIRVIFDKESKVYFKTKDYFLLDNRFEINYLDGYFYGLADYFGDKLLEKVEFGDLVFGSSLEELLGDSYVI